MRGRPRLLLYIMTRSEIIALIVAKAREYDIEPWEFLGGAIAESNLDPNAYRDGPWPDKSPGLFQQTIKYADEGDHTDSPENIARIKSLYFDPVHACDVAAKKYRYWRHDPDVPPLTAWVAYNSPGFYRTPEESPNVENYRRALSEAQAILGATTMPKVVFNPQEPAHIQEHSYDCAQDSAEWAMWSLGRKPADGWMDSQMQADGIMSTEQGLLDASGAGLAGWIQKQYGEFGFLSNNESSVSFDWAAAEGDHAYPVLLGGRAWGHWSGLYGYDPARDVLLLANPAPGWMGVQQTMDRGQFDSLGPFSAVRIWHPDLVEPVAPPSPEPTPTPPIPVPPSMTLAEVRAALVAMTTPSDDQIVGRVLREQITALADKIPG